MSKHTHTGDAGSPKKPTSDSGKPVTEAAKRQGSQPAVAPSAAPSSKNPPKTPPSGFSTKVADTASSASPAPVKPLDNATVSPSDAETTAIPKVPDPATHGKAPAAKTPATKKPSVAPVTATGAAPTGVSTPFDNPPAPAAARKSEDRWTPQISRSAIAKIVEAAVRTVPGTTEKSSGFDKITGRACPRYDIDVDADMDAVSIEAYIACTWPSPVTAVAEEARQTIIQWVKDFTGIAVAHANVTVAHVEPGGPRICRTHLEKHVTTPVINPVVVTPKAPHIPVVTKKWSITPHAVVSPDNDQVRHIEVPAPVKVSGVTVAQRPAMREVTVAPSRELSPITVAPEVPLTPITTGSLPTLTPVRVKRPMPEVPVTVKPSTPLAEISVASTHVVTPVAPRPAEVMRVRQPTPHRLAAITKDKPVRLREIEVDKTPVRRIQEPDRIRLQSVTVPDNHRVVRPEVPQPKRLARIVTRGARIHHVADPGDHVVKPGIAPADRPLKKITISPANVRRHTKGGRRK